MVKAIESERSCAVGLDFPFSLPRALLTDESWEGFVETFESRYPSAEAFRNECWIRANHRELRRQTDIETKTPFCVYNLRIFRQTFFGIRDVLAPLVASGQACVLPMQQAAKGKPWILEICPASILKREGLYVAYKGRKDELVTSRRRIMDAFVNAGLLALSEELYERAYLDSDGDALDSIVAAVGVAQALKNDSLLSCGAGSIYALEGRVVP
jgi:hypothetical protein